MATTIAVATAANVPLNVEYATEKHSEGMPVESARAPLPLPSHPSKTVFLLHVLPLFGIIPTLLVFCVTLGYVKDIERDCGGSNNETAVILQNYTHTADNIAFCYDGRYNTLTAPTNAITGENICDGVKKTVESLFDGAFLNSDCVVDNVVKAMDQAGGNVTVGYRGSQNSTGRGDYPIETPYWQAGLCPVNVHWHLGAEHLSVGEYDEFGTGPTTAHERKLLGDYREGNLCHLYDPSDETFTKEYEWKHCVDMKVGQTYEVHWPHSAAGACGTPNQYQTPFYDGVFCNLHLVNLSIVEKQVGVQAQVFTIVNDEKYYYPDLMRGMIVDGTRGTYMTYYTGSTTGTSRDNEICSNYAPITWQVDRKCSLISASTFDKMCADMKAQRDDMSHDFYAHGSRITVADHLAANNQIFKFPETE